MIHTTFNDNHNRNDIDNDITIIIVNNIPHGHALVRRIMVQSCDTWYAVRTGEHVILQYLRPFGLE